MATAARSMVPGAVVRFLVRLLLPGIQFPVLCCAFWYGYRSQEYGSRYCGALSDMDTAARDMTLGTVVHLLVWLPLPGIWLPANPGH